MSLNAHVLIRALQKMRAEFRAEGLAVPAVLFATSEDGREFLRAILAEIPTYQLNPHEYRPVMAPDATVWMEITVDDVRVRWPAQRHALPDGGWEYA